MIHFHGRALTAAAPRYMNRLCRHFRHKVAVVLEEQRARVEFPFGLCLMRADGQALHFTCQAEHDEAARRVRGVLDDHLGRFAQGERLRIDWNDGEGG